MESGGCDPEHEKLWSSLGIIWVSVPCLQESLHCFSLDVCAYPWMQWLSQMPFFFFSFPSFFLSFKLGGLSLREEYIKAASLNFLLQFSVSYILALSDTLLVHFGHSAVLLFGFFFFLWTLFSQLKRVIVSAFLVFSVCCFCFSSLFSLCQ